MENDIAKKNVRDLWIGWSKHTYGLGGTLALLSVETRIYFLNKPNLQKLFPK